MNEDASEDKGCLALLAGKQFRLLGVGGAGGRVVEHLSTLGFEAMGLAVLNTDAAALANCGVAAQIRLGERLTRGLGAGGDPEIGRAAVDEAADVIREACRGAELVMVAAGMGGGTGTGAAPVVARLARECGALVLGLVTLPFDCEGARRQRQARHGLEELKEVADVVLTLPNQRVLSLIDENTSLIETFRHTEALMAQGIRGLWHLVAREGLINVDFADLRELVRDRHAESFFACIEAEGEQRVRESVERLVLSPMVEGGALLRETGAGLVSLVAGPSLSMAEVNRVMDLVRRECEGAELLLSAAVEPSMGERLSLTFIGTRRSVDPRCAAPATPGGDAVGSVLNEGGDPIESSFMKRAGFQKRPRSRFTPPAPELTPEQRLQLVRQGARTRLRQAMLPLEVVSKGRFEKSEPTVYRGEDLDVPTFVRRGVVLN
jgi:cell division protein FtsZ